MKFKSVLISACFIFLLSTVSLGCSSQKKSIENVQSSPVSEATLSLEDFSVYKIGSPENKVAIGMSRRIVEGVVGQPASETNNDYTISCTYNSGINIVYRNDSVADITLSASSEQVYKTQRGLYVGQHDNMKTQFNQKSEETVSNSIINFIYDAEINDVLDKAPDPPREKVFVYSIGMDVVTEKIQKIRLSDNQAFVSAGQR